MEINCIAMEICVCRTQNYCILSFYEWGGKDIPLIQNFTTVPYIFMNHTAHCF